MLFAFNLFRNLRPTATVQKAILVVIGADVLLLAFILFRRYYRKRLFVVRDARIFAIREQWEAITSGTLDYSKWFASPSDLLLVQGMALDAFEYANNDESARLLKFMRVSGLIDKLISDARDLRGWRRQAALVALGRTRAAETIP